MSIFGTVKTGSGQGSSANTCASSAVNVTTGDLVIVGVGCSDGGTINSVTDTAGNTYTALTQRSGVFGVPMRFFYKLAATANAANVCTAHFSLVNSNSIIFVWAIPLSGGTALYDTDADTDGLSDATSATFNTAGSDEFVAAYVYDQNGGGGYGAGSGYTLDSASFGTFGGAEHKVFASTQTGIAATFSDPNSNNGRAIAAAFKATGGATDKTHTIDGRVQVDTSKTHTIDAFEVLQGNKTHTIDAYILFPPSVTHTIDSYVKSFSSFTHNIDAAISLPSNTSAGFVNLRANLIFAIIPGNYIRLAVNLLTPQEQFVQLSAQLRTSNRSFINLAAQIVSGSRSYVRFKATILGGAYLSHSIDASIGSSFCIPIVPPNLIPGVAPQVILPPPPTGLTDACLNQSYVRLAATLIGSSRSFVKLAAWIVPHAGFSEHAPIHGRMLTASGAPAGSSIQMPGNPNFSADDDFLSSQLALQSYSKNSIFTLTGPTLPPAGISLIIQAFTAGVQSFQTRTRSWLKREDNAPNGILVTQTQNTHKLPNGAVITTTTQVTKQQDITITIVTIQNSSTPSRVTKIVTEKNASGNTTTRETDTVTTNGVIHSETKKTVFTQPPTNDNIQPLTVRTLDGILHYQFFTKDNPEWAGGDAEGVTTTDVDSFIAPGVLNGASTDGFGNPIYKKVSKTSETDPTGKVTITNTEEVGTRRDVGTTVTDTNESFNGIETKVTKTVHYPDGATEITVTDKNSITGDTHSVTTEEVTDEFGQVTTTVTDEETKTFPDPVTGVIRQLITKTITVTKNGVSTTDTTVTQSNDFDDDIIGQKIQVYGIQEFSLTCIIDEMNMLALSDVNNTHQRSYALLELFGQQLSNGTLSYALRQQLIKQFNQANLNLAPLNMLALGRNYSIVFAQSASGFRAKYIVGTEPHAYELQLVLQSRANLIDGTFGF